MNNLNGMNFFDKSVEELKVIFNDIGDEEIFSWIQNDLKGLRLEKHVLENIKNSLEALIYTRLSSIVGEITNINKENITKLKVLSLIYAWSRTGVIFNGRFYSVPSHYKNDFFITQIYNFYTLDKQHQEWGHFSTIISYIFQLEARFLKES